jgi:hypothetical protein
MRVLLKEGATKATETTILVLPQLDGAEFETLSGKKVPRGIVAEADPKEVTAAVGIGAKKRGNPYVTAKELFKDLRWLNKALAAYEEGSPIGLKTQGGTYVLDESEAKFIDRAEGLAEGDAVAVGPTIKPRSLTNIHGKVISIKGDKVTIEVDAGDRDSFERAVGKDLTEQITIPLGCAEKVEPRPS